MKSIKQQYIDLREGNMSQANFMRNLRMTLPQYVTNVTSFEDSVRILKNKGILTEADTKASEGKWKTVTGKDLYGQFDEINNLNGQEVLIGIDYEMEKNHDLTKEAAAKIVVKNLKKNPIYYTAQDMSGIEGYEPEYIGGKSADPKAHQMKPVKGNDMVDKARGMKPVKEVEKVKKDADAKKETNTIVKGVDSMSLIAKAVRGLTKMDATGEKMKKVSVKENKVASTIFNKNAGVTDAVNNMGKDDDYVKNYNARAQAADAEQAKKDAEKNKKDTDTQLNALKGNSTDTALAGFPGLRERLKDIIRKELKEMAGAYGYGDAIDAEPGDGSSYVNEVDIYGIAGNPEEEMAARMARKPKDTYEPLSITKADTDRELDTILSNDIDTIIDKVESSENPTKLGVKLIARARMTNPSLIPGLKQALNLYNN
jgi:hypothetical protein